MKQVKTARGKIIDMGALAQAHENDRAISPGNVKMNAKGDRLDSSGNVIATVQKIATTQHKNATVPKSKKMSEAPGTGKKPSKKKVVEDDFETVIEVSRVERERDDGSVYYEIEYSDGSMTTEEKDNT